MDKRLEYLKVYKKYYDENLHNYLGPIEIIQDDTGNYLSVLIENENPRIGDNLINARIYTDKLWLTVIMNQKIIDHIINNENLHNYHSEGIHDKSSGVIIDFAGPPLSQKDCYQLGIVIGRTRAWIESFFYKLEMESVLS